MPRKKKDNVEEPELLEETKELEQDTKINNEMLKLEEEINSLTEENKKLNAENDQFKIDKEELVNKVKLAQAELINYRKRKDEETASILKYANEDIIKELINVKDNFERALQVKEDALTDELNKFLSGFKLMYDELSNILVKYGVEEINRVGKIFDPKEEQALLTDSLPDHEDEEVLEVLLKGYKLKDRVIRPASVKINQK